jgi:small subunit ribosomal protein S8
MVDPISDMFNRIKNAQALHHKEVEVPFSNLKFNIAKILEQEKFIEKVEKENIKNIKCIKINLKYNDRNPAISDFKRISKPSRRFYIPLDKIKRIRGGYGITIISTSKGLMTNKEAKKNKTGGELICEIW